MTADAWLIRRRRDDRRLATLLATARFLEAKSVDDALELLDLERSGLVLQAGDRPSYTGYRTKDLRQRLALLERNDEFPKFSHEFCHDSILSQRVHERLQRRTSPIEWTVLAKWYS